jgi:hypothetical protein
MGSSIVGVTTRRSRNHHDRRSDSPPFRVHRPLCRAWFVEADVAGELGEAGAAAEPVQRSAVLALAQNCPVAVIEPLVPALSF